MEDALLRTIARLDGTPFPSTARLASRWLVGRLPRPRQLPRLSQLARTHDAAPSPADRPPESLLGPHRALESAYCAEVVAATYQAMGLLSGRRQPQWYDPGRFWSGDDLELEAGARLGGEIAVQVAPAGTPAA
jgi:hypothetical protein